MSILFLSLTAAGIALLAFTAFAGLCETRQRNRDRNATFHEWWIQDLADDGLALVSARRIERTGRHIT